jgi:hypothetical protein
VLRLLVGVLQRELKEAQRVGGAADAAGAVDRLLRGQAPVADA